MLKRIFSYMKQYKKYACLALLCIAVEAVLELMVPMIMADLIDNGVANGDTAYIYTKGLSALTLTPSISTFVPFNKSPQIVVWPILKNT